MTLLTTPADIKTTLILVGPGGTAQAAVLCSLLGDSSKFQSPPPVIRVVAVQPNEFLQDGNDPLRPTVWRCYERQQQQQRHHGSYQPSWITHLGAPDVVYPITALSQAITGIQTPDDAGQVRFIWLCCGLSERMGLLRELVRMLLLLEFNHELLQRQQSSSSSSMIWLGTWGASWCGFDWMVRQALTLEQKEPPHNVDRAITTTTPLIALFGLDNGLGHCRLVGAAAGTEYHTQTNNRFSSTMDRVVVWQSPKRQPTLTVTTFADTDISACCHAYLQQILTIQDDPPSYLIHPTACLESPSTPFSVNYATSLSFLALSLMDASTMLTASVLYVCPDLLQQQKNRPRNSDLSKAYQSQVGSLVLDMVHEILGVLQRLDQVFLRRPGNDQNHDHHSWLIIHAVTPSLLSNAFGLSVWGMEMTGNTAHEIQQRMDRGTNKRGLLQYQSLLQSWAAQAAWQEWQGLVLLESPIVPSVQRLRRHHDKQRGNTNNSKSEGARSHNNAEDFSNHKRVEACDMAREACQQLLFVLGLAEIMDMNLSSGLPTMLRVVRQLQARVDKTYVLVPHEYETCSSIRQRNSIQPRQQVVPPRLVQDAPHVGETMAPQALGLTTKTQLLTFLNSSSCLVGDDDVLKQQPQTSRRGVHMMHSRL